LDEGTRTDHAALRMPPAQQRFGAHHRLVGESDLRLKEKLEFVLRESPSQLDLKPAPGSRLRPQHRHEQPVGVPAVGLGLVEGEIGVGGQLVDRRAVLR